MSYGGEGLAALVAGVTLEAPALLAAATEPLPGVEWGGEHVLRHGMRGCVRARRRGDARARVCVTATSQARAYVCATCLALGFKERRRK